ncbi:MAG: hypothetical protein VKK59_01195, partial [Vampirovibrionales bacterium]|nr:hypothetical protein [Vampirovibrionales bacterium]
MQVRHYSLLDSTNDEARRLLALGELAPGSTTLIVADTQTAGRGTRGRSWCSPTGGLYMTVVHRAPDAHCLAGTGQGEKIENYWLNRLHSPASVALTLAAGIASQHVLNDVIELSTGQRPLRLKPINDVMIPVPRAASGNSEWGGELLKLAGILVETQLLPTGQLSAVMTGIGVNLSHAPAGLPA